MSEVIIEAGEPDFFFVSYDISDPVARARVRVFLKTKLFVAHNYSLYYGPWHATILSELNKFKAQEEQEILKDPERKGEICDIRIILTKHTKNELIELSSEWERKFAEQWEELEAILDETDEMISGNIPKTWKEKIKKEVTDAEGKKSIITEDIEKSRPYNAKELLQRISHSKTLIGQVEEALAKRKEIQQEKWQYDASLEQQHDRLYKRLRDFTNQLDKQRQSVRDREAREAKKEQPAQQPPAPQ